MRNEPGMCWALILRALRWGVDPLFAAESCYLVKNPKTGEEKVAYMAQLINAIVNNAQHKILEGKLRVRYEGEGDDMRAIVFGIPKHETEPLEYRSPTLGERKQAVGYNESGKLRGSPLYETDPQQQMWYYASRAFIRRYYPEVLGGVYTGEELAEDGHERMRDVTPVPTVSPAQALMDRMKAKKRDAASRGFDANYIERETARANGGATEEKQDEGGITGGNGDEIRAEGGDADAVADRGPDDTGAGDAADRPAGEAGGGAADRGEAGEAQQELIPPDDAGRKAAKARSRQ
jgi:hypothetical protein